MSRDSVYTNGVIASKEQYLLKDKIFKLCESSAEDAFRTLLESGFGKSAEVASVYDYERLVSADEADIDKFIREYSPSQSEAQYLLASRDFHNAKALLKARFSGLESDNMLAPEGLISIQEISDCISEEKYDKLGKHLGGAVKLCAEKFSENSLSGADAGIIFEKALFSHLFEACSKNRLLKKLLTVKADMTNILTALRSYDKESAESCYVSGGKLSNSSLEKLFSDDKDRAEHSLDNTPYSDFLKICFADRAEGQPLTQAERTSESYEIQYLSARKYDLVRNEPFLYYVFRRRAENANVRILFVCLLAGMSESEIKHRLR